MARKSNQINEVTIRLLPEKEKRDYFLRLVAFLIFLFFVILNFFITFLPRLNLMSDLNKINRDNYNLESKYYNLYEQFKNIDIEVVIDGKKQKLYDVAKNNDAVKIAYGQLDLIEVVADLHSELSKNLNQYLEQVRFDAATNQITITVLFSTYNDVVAYSNKVKAIEYVKTITLINVNEIPMGEGLNRQRAIYSITLDAGVYPEVKVREVND